MSYDFTGKLIRIYDTEQIKETFKKREFVVEQVDGQYPNPVKFELTQERCGLLDGYQEGQDVTVSFDVSGRAWNDKYFTNLRAWRIQEAGASGSDASGGGSYQSNQGGGSYNNAGGGAPSARPAAPVATEPNFSSGETTDDLPF